jgi:hypothetical protein
MCGSDAETILGLEGEMFGCGQQWNQSYKGIVKRVNAS